MKKYKKNKKITYQYIQGAAYRYLERYATTEANLKFILQRKVKRIVANYSDEMGAPEDIDEWISDVVSKVVKLGLVDDRLYAQSKLNSFMASGNSIATIRQKLRAKGVPLNLIDEVVNEAKNEQPDVDFISAIKYAKRRKFGPFRIREPKDNTGEKEKAAMARAGYSFDEVKRVLTNSREDLEDILYGN